MKNIKTFESFEIVNRIQLLKNATLYVKKNLGITKEEGLMDVEYSDHSWTNFVTISLYFYNWTKKEKYNSVYKFLKSNNLEILRELNMNSIFEIDIKISEYKIKKFAELYTAMIKYNL